MLNAVARIHHDLTLVLPRPELLLLRPGQTQRRNATHAGGFGRRGKFPMLPGTHKKAPQPSAINSSTKTLPAFAPLPSAASPGVGWRTSLDALPRGSHDSPPQLTAWTAPHQRPHQRFQTHRSASAALPQRRAVGATGATGVDPSNVRTSEAPFCGRLTCQHPFEQTALAEVTRNRVRGPRNIGRHEQEAPTTLLTDHVWNGAIRDEDHLVSHGELVRSKQR